MHPFSLFVVINKAVVCKDLHVMRKGRLRDIQFLQQITSTLFSMLERKYDRKVMCPEAVSACSHGTRE